MGQAERPTCPGCGTFLILWVRALVYLANKERSRFPPSAHSTDRARGAVIIATAYVVASGRHSGSLRNYGRCSDLNIP